MMAEQKEQEALSKVEFWQRIAGIAFTLWSLMIPLGVWMVSNVFERATRANAEAATEITMFNRRFEAYVLNMERRITIVEERQNQMFQTLTRPEPASGKKGN